MFAAGLFLFLKPLHTPSAYVILGVSSLALLFQLVTTFIPFIDEFSPFSLPITRECHRLWCWEKAAIAMARQRWQIDTSCALCHISIQGRWIRHVAMPPCDDQRTIQQNRPFTVETSSAHSPGARHIEMFLRNWMKGISLAFCSSARFVLVIWGVHLPPLRKGVSELAGECHRQRQSIHYATAHAHVIGALLRNTVVAPEHLPVYISGFEHSGDPHIRPQDWRLIINILDELQVNVGALSRTEARGML